MAHLINNIYETGEQPKGFTESRMTALQKKPKATKCSDHHTTSLIIHEAKRVARVLKRRIVEKTEDTIGRHKFGFRSGKGTRDTIRTLRVKSQ